MEPASFDRGPGESPHDWYARLKALSTHGLTSYQQRVRALRMEAARREMRQQKKAPPQARKTSAGKPPEAESAAAGDPGAARPHEAAERDQLWESLRVLLPDIQRLADGGFDGSERDRQFVQLLARIVAAELSFRAPEDPGPPATPGVTT